MLTESDAVVNWKANAVAALLDAIRIYDGDRPASADSPAWGKLLAEVHVGSADAAKAGVLTFRPKRAAIAKQTGRASWFRGVGRDGMGLFDGTVGPAGDIVLKPAIILAGAEVGITVLTYEQPK